MMEFGKKKATEATKSDTKADSIKEKSEPGKPIYIIPYYTTQAACERSTVVGYCKKCNDTSFEMLVANRMSGKCCRCGEKYG